MFAIEVQEDQQRTFFFLSDAVWLTMSTVYFLAINLVQKYSASSRSLSLSQSIMR